MAVFRLRIDPHLLLSRDDWPAHEELFTTQCSDVGNGRRAGLEAGTNVPGSVEELRNSWAKAKA
ncbi:hypothetical protein Dimus_035633 [Dionaea muscipula]